MAIRPSGPVRALLVAAVLAGCAAAQPPAAESPAAGCPTGLERWIMTELYFGLTWRHGAITAAQWQAFVDSEIVPRLPEGFTVLGGEGAWRSTHTGETIREPSRLLQRLRKPGPAQEAALAGIVAAYRTLFAQDSVLRVDTEVCAAF